MFLVPRQLGSGGRSGGGCCLGVLGSCLGVCRFCGNFWFLDRSDKGDGGNGVAGAGASDGDGAGPGGCGDGDGAGVGVGAGLLLLLLLSSSLLLWILWMLRRRPV